MINYPVQIESIENCGNGYGWSIIKPQPKDNGLPIFEIAVLKDGYICYNTPITNDVIRGTWPHICNIKKEIKALPSDHYTDDAFDAIQDNWLPQ